MELTIIKGIGKTFETKLMDAGIKSVEDLAVADIDRIAETTGISKARLSRWKELARKMVGERKAEIAEDISKITSIEVEREAAKVRIKDAVHIAPFYEGDFDKIKEDAEKEKIAVYIGKKAKLWFNGKWYDNLPFKDRRKGLFSFLRRKK
ncbi:MAG: helix-hairpin-helix domain-containing protein [Thermoplasmata archaeon]|nr:helix-hairpin-helix domain-containing protein [Thermoplasmata archaeon]